MNKEFIPYEEALALKELGFDKECLAIYYKDDVEKKLLFSIEEKYSSNPEVAKHQARNAIRDINFEKGWAIAAPLYQQAFRWFREKHNKLHTVNIDLSDNLKDKVYVLTIEDHLGSIVDRSEEYGTYEEAELTCLKKLIEELK